MLIKRVFSAVAIAAALVLGTGVSTLAFDGKKKSKVTFKVRIENVSTKDGLTAADGSKYPFALSPGMWAANEGRLMLFRSGKKASPALEAQAEDGNPSPLTEFAVSRHLAGYVGVFTKPVGSDMDAPILPGGAYEFTFEATRGMTLNVAAMYGQSNDLFYAPESSLELFDNKGQPITGDLTDKFLLWDAGTEVNQAPGIGSEQAPRQKMKNEGMAEKSVVQLVKDGFMYPNAKDVLRITISVQ